ncbi:unnamed protein product [Rotaria sp. Silwood2]|nr:unnamed protein product [Rotaria sp. Silwood2]CAF4453357.1 unnamed protein product [Rotaria sp. Silwood2]
MAIYNRWAFQQLYNKLDKYISNEMYNADNGLYFRSIHGTLVHIVLASKLWYARLANSSSYSLNDEKYPYEINSYWSRSANEWEQAILDRKNLYYDVLSECDRWIDYIEQLDSESLMTEETFSYFDTEGNKTERNRSEALDHVFNHTTHHRGQITAIITKYSGQEASPILDLSAMPTNELNNIN